MIVEDLLLYFKAAEILEAQELLREFTVVDYPNLKKTDRQRIHKQTYKLAFPDQKKRVISVEDLKKILGSVS